MLVFFCTKEGGVSKFPLSFLYWTTYKAKSKKMFCINKIVPLQSHSF